MKKTLIFLAAAAAAYAQSNSFQQNGWVRFNDWTAQFPTVVDAVLATPHATQGTPAYANEMSDRCRAASILLLSWSLGPSSPEEGHRRSWTTWNYAQATARRAVHARQAELQRLACPQATSR